MVLAKYNNLPPALKDLGAKMKVDIKKLTKGNADEYVEYCIQDAKLGKDLYERLDMPEHLWLEYYADLRVNDRGYMIDVPRIKQMIKQRDILLEQLEKQWQKEIGISNARSTKQVKEWLLKHNERCESLTGYTSNNPTVQKMLDMRSELTNSSLKKLDKMLLLVGKNDRIRGSFAFFHADTGRWAGRGVQPQNLPRTREYIGTPTLESIKGSLRTCIIAPKGKQLAICDYSSIEPRIYAWLVKEQWLLDSYKCGEDVYKQAYTLVYNEPCTTKQQRQIGKTAVLSLNYGGGVTTLQRQAELLGLELSTSSAERICSTYRNKSRAIVNLWHTLEKTIKTSLVYKNKKHQVGEHLTIETIGSQTRIALPSGRDIIYNDLKSLGRGLKCGTMNIWGGIFANNVIQALGRDILAHALIKLQDRAILHVHDEIVVECVGESDIKEVMLDVPDWAKDIPLAAEVQYSTKYNK